MKATLATTWMDGCSGCHMSFLDLDERLIELGEHVDLVYSPLVDFKQYPDHVDICLVEGAISSVEDLHRIKLIRDRTTTLVAFGDCSVTTNVPGMRNPIGVGPILKRGYEDNATLRPGAPTEVVPALLPVVQPVHQVVTVDHFLPGCPPSADLIWSFVLDLLAGRTPNVAGRARFGR